MTDMDIICYIAVWCKFLDHVGKYAKRYYLSRDLELPPAEQDPQSHLVMKRHYGSEERLNGAIEHDLDTFSLELHAINAAQMACDLPPFSIRDDYLARIVMGFAMLDRHGKERRKYYRSRINQLQKTLNGGGQVTVPSLNQLEADFLENQRRVAERKTRKATKAK